MLGGMATIGAAGALGAGTWAEYSDQETAQLTVEAGTLNLTIDGQDGNKAKVHVGPLEPADANPDGNVFSESFTLKNTGTQYGNRQGLRIDHVGSNEGVNNEAETNTDGNGELDDQLEIRAYVTNGASKRDYLFGSSDSFVDYNSVRGESSGRGGFPMGPDATSELVVEGRFKNSPNNNAAQGDELVFNVLVTLYQRNAPAGA
jgi:predicted ribosomally synthesized peptide with SipW-like signal peptide